MTTDPGAFFCDRCDGECEEDDPFCPRCGALFEEDVRCEEHPDREASGACVICRRSLCEDCGGDVSGSFLCEEHAGYEVSDGVVPIFTGDDFSEVGSVSGCLEQAGLHPTVFTRRSSPLAVTARDRRPPELDEGPPVEIEVRVPCSEVEEAEGILRDLGFL